MCGAVRNAQQNARFNKSAQQKRPCRPKTVKRFFGGSGSHGLSGQAKERMRILPVRSFFLRPARRAMCRAGRSCAACRCYAGFLRPVPVCLPCVLCAQFRLVLAVCLPVLRCLHAHFSLIFRLFLFGFLPLKLLFICRSCRDGHPIFFSERKWGKRTARGAACRSPSNPIPAPCGQSSPLSRCWPA